MRNSIIMQLLGLLVNVMGIALLFLASLDFLKMITLDSGANLAMIGILLAICGYLVTLIAFKEAISSAISKKILNHKKVIA